MLGGLLHHVEVYVSDLSRSSEFWGWFLEELGYEPYQDWEDGKSWRSGDTYLVFVQTRERFLEAGYQRCRIGLNHLAFHAHSADQVDRLTDALRNRGVRILYEDRHPHAGGKQHYGVYFEDPDRIKVELVAP